VKNSIAYIEPSLQQKKSRLKAFHSNRLMKRWKNKNLFTRSTAWG